MDLCFINKMSCLSGLKDLQLETEREAEIISWTERVVAYFINKVEVARTKLIEKGDRFMPSFPFGELERDAFSGEDMKTEACREPIITFWITVGLPSPKLAVEQDIDISSARQRLEREMPAQRNTPWIIVLLSCESKLGIVVGISRDKTEEHIGLPMFPVVIPTQSGRDQSHRTGELELRITWDKLLPSLLVLFQAFLVGSKFLPLCRQGQEA